MAQARVVRAALEDRAEIALLAAGNARERGASACSATITVIYATELNEALFTQTVELLSARTSATLVALCGEINARCTQLLLSAGVWNVIVHNEQGALLDALIATAARLHEVEAALQSNLVRNHLLGESTTWRVFLRELIWVAKYSSASVLLNGETGTGKELLARLLHTLDTRDEKGEMVIVDCTTLNHELAGSELFGHERGAYTGAHVQRVGAAALANGGTLFLDEVGELQLPVQAQLLRLLQEGTYKSVGGSAWRRSSFRLICATHRDLRDAVATGRFREDLYFRLNGWTAQVPALRARAADIPVLADRFLQEFGCTQGIDHSVAQALAAHPFPGNVRELRQLMMQSAVKHCGGSRISIGDLPMAWHRASYESGPANAAPSDADLAVSAQAAIEQWVRQSVHSGLGLRDIAQRAGDIAINEALALERNHVGRAARRLGVTERAIQLRKAQRSASASATNSPPEP